MHENGNVYCIQSNSIYTFYNGDLTNYTMVDVPTDLNSNSVQTNGMLVTSDGYLVVKQWAFNMEVKKWMTVESFQC